MIFGPFVAWVMMSRNRVFEDQLLVLHRVNYQDSGLLLDGYSLNHGRIRLLVKGAKSGKSNHAMQPFQLFFSSWLGCGELKTLIRRELLQTIPLKKAALYCGFYLNELLLRTTPLEMASENIFELYLQTIQCLEQSATQTQQELLLRQFEWSLIQELGYGFSLTENEAGDPLHPNKNYVFVQEQGLVEAKFVTRHGSYGEQILFLGADLLALAEWRLTTPQKVRVAKHLMRVALQSVLGPQPLKTRVLYQQMLR